MKNSALKNVNFMESSDRLLPFTMRVLQRLFGFLTALLVLFTALPLAAQAASSAAIRAYDDVEAATKDYAGQSLIRAEFNNVRLIGANFSGADLRGAVFNGAILTKANFHRADFSNGIAYVSDLSEADLSDAIFTSAMLLKSSFRHANITGADFTYASLDREQVVQLCKSASGINSKTGADTRESLECP